MKRRFPSLDLGVFLLLTAGAVLLLSQLDNGRLWQDEAETAVLARNTLSFGYPRAFDGINWVNPGLPVEAGYAWTYHSWLPMYLTAFSFLILGVQTWTARLPFALLGIASLWLTRRLIKRLTGDPGLARLGLLFCVTSVPFLLHLRQCRYYAAAVFFTLWATLAYWHFFQGKRRAQWLLVAALTFLFHAEHGAFAPVAAALAIHFIAHRGGPAGWYQGLKVLLLVAGLVVPWAVYLQSGQHHNTLIFKEVKHHFEFYFRQINRFLFPIGFWVAVYLIWRRKFHGLFGERGSTLRQAWGLIGTLVGVGILFLTLVPEQRHFRYLVFLIPFLLMTQAALAGRLIQWRPLWGWLLTAILLTTDLIQYSGLSLLGQQIPAIRSRLSSPDVKIRSLPLEFLGDLTQPYRGPIDGIVEHLQRHSQPNQTLKTPPAEDIPLIFYTHLKVEPLTRFDDFKRESYPDWIVLRRDWLPGGFFESPYYAQIQARYRKILLDAPDIPWQNRPDPGYHRFRTDRDAPPVVVFHKQR